MLTKKQFMFLFRFKGANNRYTTNKKYTYNIILTNIFIHIYNIQIFLIKKYNIYKKTKNIIKICCVYLEY